MNDMPQIENLEQAITATLCYFDIFDYPLTEFEVWQFLFWPKGPKTNITEVIHELEHMIQTQSVQQNNGFYFLPGREQTVATRLTRYPRNIENWKKSQKLFSHLSQVPYFKAAALCNMFTLNNQKDTSDIDVFIITSKNRIWTTRAIITFLTFIRRQWRHGSKIANRFCLSFYVTDDNLDLSFMRQKPYDIYLIYWIATIAFVKGDETARDFFKNNAWVKDYLPNFEPRVEIEFHHARAKTYEKFAHFEEKIWDSPFGNFREKNARTLQLKKMGLKKHELASEPSRDVKISDHILKFHENDRRAIFRENFEKRLASQMVSTK